VLNVDPYARPDSPRCEECPLTLLEPYIASGAGQLIAQVIDLDFALQTGVTVSSSEITFPEFLLLRLLAEERNRFHEEQMKKATHRHGR